jgi:hypothetical protein
MAWTEKRGRVYRVRYHDPLGRQHPRSFTRKADADRFAREVEVDKQRGSRLDPRVAALRISIVRCWTATSRRSA